MLETELLAPASRISSLLRTDPARFQAIRHSSKRALGHRCLIFLLASISLHVAASEQLALSPARFETGEQALETLIKFPKVGGDITETIHCSAIVSKSGRYYGNRCYATDLGRRFHHAIIEAAESARAIPAIVEDQKIRVHIHYRVLFEQTGDSSIIRVIPNWGSDSDQIDSHYQAPQRVAKRFAYPRTCNGADLAITRIKIDQTGKAVGKAMVNFQGEFNGPCASALGQILESSTYLPGLREGRPIEATYMQMWVGYQLVVM